MTRSRPTARRAFSLMEAIAAIVVISLAAPPTFLLMSDAASVRRDLLLSERALWLATGVMEHVVADVNSEAPGLGPDALAEAVSYIDSPTVGLRDRIAPMTADYEAQGLSWRLEISDFVSSNGVATGDADQDLFRTVTIHVEWTQEQSEPGRLTLSRMVTVR